MRKKLRHFAITRKRFQLIRRMYFFLNWLSGHESASGHKSVVHYTPKMYRHARTWEKLGIFEKLDDMKKRGDSPADAARFFSRKPSVARKSRRRRYPTVNR